jgi:hypothetical protein
MLRHIWNAKCKQYSCESQSSVAYIGHTLIQRSLLFDHGTGIRFSAQLANVTLMNHLYYMSLLHSTYRSILATTPPTEFWQHVILHITPFQYAVHDLRLLHRERAQTSPIPT